MDDKTTIKRVKREKVWELTDAQKAELNELSKVIKIASDAMADSNLKLMKADVAKTEFWNKVKRDIPDEITGSKCMLTLDESTMSVYVEPDEEQCPLSNIHVAIQRMFSNKQQ